MSLSQLPAELLLWIGRYLTNEALALLCFYNVELRSTFADRNDYFIDSQVLLWAAKVGDIETMQLALENGGDVNFKEWDGRTPLSFVAERGDIAMTNLILEAKDAGCYEEDTGHESPLLLASEMGHKAVVDLIVEKSDPDYIHRALEVAACHGHAGIVERLFLTAKEKDPGFCSYYGYGETLLRSAAQIGDEGTVRLYLAVGINHNARDDCGRSPLYLASGSYGSVMTLLIAAGADVNMGDHDGRTPLMHAVQTGYKTGVEILLGAKGIDVHVRDAEGETALSLAESVERDELVDMLRAVE